jgi:hypothetical protein
MGMYWWTELYYGRLVSAESVARLKASAEDIGVIDAYLHAFSDHAGRCILRPPGCLVRIGSSCPVLDAGDSAKGVVSWEDLRRASRDAPGLIDAVERGPTSQDAATLGRLLRLAAPAVTSDAGCAPGVYICEATWNTYGPGCHVTKNIRVAA